MRMNSLTWTANRDYYDKIR